MKPSSIVMFLITIAASQAGCQIGWASSCHGPDPAVVRIEFSGAPNASRMRITAVIRNNGSADFESFPGQQSLVLYEGRRLLAEQGFDRLAAGQEFRATFEIEADPAARATYEAAIVFAPNIYQDDNPANDDCNRDNNRLQERPQP